MSGLCGWIGDVAPADRSRRIAGEMSSILAREDGGQVETLLGSGAGLAVCSRGGSLAGEGRLLAGIQGASEWTDPDLARIAADTGAARALLEGWRRRGASVLDVLRGHFAAAIVDENRGETLLATDRVGSVPVLYARADDCLVFATRGECLQAHPRGAAPVDPQAIYDYLYHGFVPAPQAMRRGHRRLLPGQMAQLSGARLQTTSYSEVDYRDGERVRFDELARDFREQLRRAVARHAQGAEVGCFLSGGTDSSTVAGLLGEVTGAPARTFSIGFDAAGYDEMAYARIAVRRFRTEHHEHYLTPDEVVDSVPRIARIYSDPFGNESAVAAHYCARMARAAGVERMLAGDGGDELFGGNARYAKPRLFAPYRALPSFVRRIVEPVLFGFPGGDRIPPLRKVRSYVRQANVPMPDRMAAYNYLERFGPATVLEPDFLRQVDSAGPLAGIRDVWARAHTGCDLNRMLAIDMKFVLADCDLPKVSRMCELAGVDAAYPLLDDGVVDLAARVPARWKLRGTRLRWFFKEALKDFLPREILRKKKHGFGLPFGIWMASHSGLQELARDSLGGLKRRGIVRAAFIDDLLRLHAEEHAKYYGVMIWWLLMLEQWFRAHEDGAQCAG